MNQLNFDVKYSEWLRSSESIKNINTATQPVYAINTAYFDESGDNIEIFAYPQNDGRVRLTDGSWVLNQLMMRGVNMLTDTQAVQKVSQIADKFQVNLDSDSRLSIDVSADFTNIGMARTRLLTAMLVSVNNID